MAGKTVKRAFKYRFHPTNAQTAELSRTFGCVRLVYNEALAARTQAWYQCQERVNYNQTSAMLTQWKKEDDLAFLSEVSSVPSQRALRHLQGAFSHFFAKRAAYPRFKSRKRSKASAEYTPSAFRYRDGKLTTRLVRENQVVVVEDLAVRGWTCACGATHDRDVNAAINIRAAGLAVAACGAGVRPQRESSRAGRSASKQETQRATAGITRLQAGEEAKDGPSRPSGAQ